MSKKESIKKYYFSVLITQNINFPLIYYFNKKIDIGTIVSVTLNKRKVLGCVINEIEGPISSKFEIKKVIDIFWGQSIDKNLIKFVEWFSNYNLVSLGKSLKLFIPNKLMLKHNVVDSLEKNAEYKDKLSIKQKKLLYFLNQGNKSYLKLRMHGFSRPYIKNLLKKKVLIKEEKRLKINHNLNIKKKLSIKLSNFQKKVLDEIFASIRTEETKPILFDGVMGSGKTEVYFKVIEHYIKKQKQVLILLPEIALSTQWIERFKKVFGFDPLVWNSVISNLNKNKIWQSAINKDTIVVVGSRSSLFLPFRNLGIIIIDEENDLSYKQEDITIYNARDMAIVRSKKSFNPVLLVSATPSLESYNNAKSKKYNYIKLSRRYKNAEAPLFKTIDMKKEKKKILALQTIKEIKKNIILNKQSLLLVNRRGYAPIQVCIKCGTSIKCKHCSTNMVLHKNKSILLCHHCGAKKEITQNCETCKSKNSIIELGFGVEKVYEEVKKIFKDEKVVVLSSDTIDKDSFSKTLKDIEENKINIIIGTQIISKGFDFSHLTKVFMLDFDMWFYNSDLRTTERTFQLTEQISGRVGRRNIQGEVYIQTYDTRNKLLEQIIKKNRDLFYEEELIRRNVSSLPPFIKIAAIILSGEVLKQVEKSALDLVSYLKQNYALEILGPIPAPIHFLRHKYRFRLLLKSKKVFYIQKCLQETLLGYKYNKKIKLKIDIDPYSFF